MSLALMFSWFASTARADTFRLLPDDAQALQVRVDLIQQAQHEIDCAYYGADTGRVPAAVLSLLVEAAQRGVRVRLLVDGLMSRLPEGLHRTLRHHGVDIQIYRPPDGLSFRVWNKRMHDKLLIVDKRRLIVGSRNLQDAHFGVRDPRFMDCDAFIEGSTAARAAAYFQWMWDQPHVRPLEAVNLWGRTVASRLPLVKDAWRRAWQQADSPEVHLQLMWISRQGLIDRGMISLDTGNDWSSGGDRGVPLELVHEVDADKSQRWVQRRLLRLIDSSTRSLLIQTPYPVFTDDAMRALFAARHRGVRVVLCTNSLHSTDRLITFSAFENIKDALLAAGVEIYEMPGPEHLHSKAMVIDDAVGVIGSYNFDERSAKLNTEVCVIAPDVRVAMRLRRMVEDQMSGGRRVGVSPPLLEDQHPAVGRGREWTMQMGRLLVPPIRWLL
ncbi:phospholipase D-like domain-containing protein [Roseimaritima sediminicola]|uniref:phospholipase D-like domain-containing protein n=1 Tax=Roseimaritima sediminicola TaxID=2662066 RepID=UPI001386E263|nr:phosphatidylserine/phosphatidylglycerophosphate/cardiolipin synthase family protein [Roseimaritima sediminicola]